MIHGTWRPAAVALALVLALPLAGQGAQKTYSVSDAKSLLKAVGPDRTIVLKKGDYKLSSAYGVDGDYVEWQDAEEGKELYLKDLKNLTIRGADGARIVGDSASAYLLCLSNSSNVALDNLRFARNVDGEAEAAAGSLYAESVQGLVVDRCFFEGPTGTAIELWESPGARIRRTTVKGAVRGAFSIMYSGDFEATGAKVLDCEGYPLVYIEESDQVLVSTTRFEGCQGGNFIEIYAESGSVEAVGFSECAFVGNTVDYFSGTSIIPYTEGCSFEDNSFGEDWAENSVAYYEDESYYYGEEEGGPAYYAHYASGLGFSYPEYWELRESGDQGRVGLFAPGGEALVIFTTVYQLPAKADPARQAKKIFADSAAALIKLLDEEADIALSIGPEGEPSDETGIMSAYYTGSATKGEGEHAEARVRLMLSEGSIHAFVALAKDPSGLESGSDADSILSSADYAPRGD